MSRADEIFDNVMKAMQDAEEIYGVEGKEYIDLMKRISTEALDRIETYSKWRGLSVPHLAVIIKGEILAHVREGIVPREVKSFSELHDYVDANCYGELCDTYFSNMLRELCGDEDAFISFVNAVQGDVDHWIKQGHIIRAMEEEDRNG